MVLEVKDLTKKYMKASRVFAAVSRVTLSLEAGDCCSIFGCSGSGKSTFLNMAAGLTVPTSGSVTLDGQDIAALNEKELSYLKDSKIGYIPQAQNIQANLTVFENVCLPFYLCMKARRHGPARRTVALLEQAGISHLAASYPRQLSKAELRRVSIARALINNPALLIADEPAGDLDAGNAAEIMKLFRLISEEGTAILLTTREPPPPNYGTKVYSMTSGILTEYLRLIPSPAA
jgi:putative ABC transport system ATP-binding protein